MAAGEREFCDLKTEIKLKTERQRQRISRDRNQAKDRKAEAETEAETEAEAKAETGIKGKRHLLTPPQHPTHPQPPATTHLSSKSLR